MQSAPYPESRLIEYPSILSVPNAGVVSEILSYITFWFNPSKGPRAIVLWLLSLYCNCPAPAWLWIPRCLVGSLGY
jgi:hypothetical protein